MPLPPSEFERPRKFYTAVDVRPEDGAFVTTLDGRRARTPAGIPLAAPTEAMARLLAAEWDAQQAHIDLATMPGVRLAYTAIDRTAAARAETAAEVARFADADVLCYFAEGPAAVLEAEVRHWVPVLDWAHDALGLTMLRVTGIAHRPQPPETLARVEALALELEPLALTGVAFCAALFGSAILAFAVQRGELSGDAAFELSRLDEALQVERWGEDAEAAARIARLRTEAELADRWFRALRT
jgi:chaperone required for assembly of F1-ATPase